MTQIYTLYFQQRIQELGIDNIPHVDEIIRSIWSSYPNLKEFEQYLYLILIYIQNFPQMHQIIYQTPFNMEEIDLFIKSHNPALIKINKEKEIQQLLNINVSDMLIQVYYCPIQSCRSRNIKVEERQIRRAYEGATQFYTCQDCGKTWTI